MMEEVATEVRAEDPERILLQVRRLTPLECERLQGLPDDWICLCGANAPTGPGTADSVTL